jgi:hypothetical protein
VLSQVPGVTRAFTRTRSLLEERHGAIVPSHPPLADRRSKLRYPLDLGVRFRPLAGSLFCGAGRAVNVSSGGIWVVSRHVVSEHELSVGALVEISIEWPSLLDGRVPLQLLAVGRVVRHRASNFAAAFERYQFRTMKTSNLPHARLRGDVVQWPGS